MRFSHRPVSDELADALASEFEDRHEVVNVVRADFAVTEDELDSRIGRHAEAAKLVHL